FACCDDNFCSSDMFGESAPATTTTADPTTTTTSDRVTTTTADPGTTTTADPGTTTTGAPGPHTGTGDSVVVTFPAVGASITFSNVTVAGETPVTSVSAG